MSSPCGEYTPGPSGCADCGWHEDDHVRPLGWWSISGEALLDALREVEQGESADLVYASLYGEADREQC